MKDFVSPANLLTSGNLIAGFLALILAARGDFVWAAGLVGVAAIFDSVDGIAARRSGSQSEFGSRLDSLADLVSFGAAPGLVLYIGALHELPVLGLAASMAFVLAGAWRLARFSLLEDPHYFVGFPIPPAAVVSLVLVVSSAPVALVCAVTALLAALMVSTVSIPTFAQMLITLRRPAQGDLQPTGESADEAPSTTT